MIGMAGRGAGRSALIARLDADGLHRQRDDVLATYEEVYAGHLDDPYDSPSRYWKRLAAYASRSGFAAVTARVGQDFVGYALGYPLPAETRWWAGLKIEVDSSFVAEDGSRTFVLDEIMVRADWRRQGHAMSLHDELLRDRAEERATLLVRQDNLPARLAYLRWGWQTVGPLQPFAAGPTFDAMVLDLRARRDRTTCELAHAADIDRPR